MVFVCVCLRKCVRKLQRAEKPSRNTSRKEKVHKTVFRHGHTEEKLQNEVFRFEQLEADASSIADARSCTTTLSVVQF